MSDYYKHTSSFVDDNTTIGDGTNVWHFSHVMPNSVIGKNCILGQHVHVASGAVIGDNVKIQNNVSIYKGVEVENDVFLGPSMVFTNVHNPRAFVERKDEFRKTTVKEGASIGANATIVCGNSVGRCAFVGAGAVVTRDILDYEIVAGVPARHMGWMCKCGEKLPRNDRRGIFECGCGLSYAKVCGNLFSYFMSNKYSIRLM